MDCCAAERTPVGVDAPETIDIRFEADMVKGAGNECIFSQRSHQSHSPIALFRRLSRPPALRDILVFSIVSPASNEGV